MQDHTVSVAQDDSNVINFAPVFNVASVFIDRHPDEGRAEKTAISTHDGERVTYAELRRRCNQAANLLSSLNLEAGDRVLMIVKDCPAFFYLFWGAIKIGVIPVPVNTLLKGSDYHYMLEDSQAKLLVYSREFTDEVQTALGLMDSSTTPSMAASGEEEDFVERMASFPDEVSLYPSQPMDDCFWLYSSGSTGSPKGAVHLHRDMVITSQHYGVETLGIRESDRCFSAAKLFFAYGLGNAMTFPLWVGASAVLFDRRPTPDSTFEVIKTFQPTLYFGVPTLYAAQLKLMDETPQDTSSVRMCVSAGEALPGDLFERWQQHTGLEILDGIGSTEALHIFISNRPGDVRIGTSGLPVPGYSARIVDESGMDVEDNQSGQLLIKGESSARCYWNKPEKTEQTMLGEWLNTGDTYIRDEDGYYHYCGRNDDMMKVGGIWCSPFEIEAALISHPDVLEVAVVGKEDSEGLVKPSAHVVLQDAGKADERMSQTLMQHCKDQLAPYKYPRWFSYVGDLPKTATGKIQRFKLRD